MAISIEQWLQTPFGSWLLGDTMILSNLLGMVTIQCGWRPCWTKEGTTPRHLSLGCPWMPLAKIAWKMGGHQFVRCLGAEVSCVTQRIHEFRSGGWLWQWQPLSENGGYPTSVISIGDDQSWDSWVPKSLPQSHWMFEGFWRMECRILGPFLGLSGRGATRRSAYGWHPTVFFFASKVIPIIGHVRFTPFFGRFNLPFVCW